MKRRWRVSGVTALAAAVIVLLPALAWLQYSWLDQIADADRDRRERTLQTAASQLVQDFDGELAKAVAGLQIESSMVEQGTWSNYASRYQAWSDSAIAPEIVKAVYFVEGPEPHGAREGQRTQPRADVPLRMWNADSHTFEPTEWPPQLQSVRMRFGAGDRRIEIFAPSRGRGERGERFDRMLLPPTASGDEQSIILPIMRFAPQPRSEPNADPAPPDVRLLGFTLLRLDLNALGKDVLPALVKRHLFDERGHSDYLVAVVSRDNPSQVIYESTEGAAMAAAAQPDATTTLLGSRVGPMLFMARDGRRGRGGPGGRDSGGPEDRVVVNLFEARRDGGARVESRVINPGEGHWRLVAKHRAGSLEAAVAAARTRNFVLSSGVLALLAAAIGLIVVSARRADRLARQQLEFVAAVSHELRTPVSVIGAAAGNLADGVVDEPGRVKTYGATIQTEARRLAETVERVLQLAGIAAGRASAAPVAIPVATLIDEAVAASRAEIEMAGATLEVDIAPDLLHLPTDASGVQRVVGDRAALRSAIQNLISNAIKYGGSDRWVRISAAPAKHQATRITVADHGLGISAEDRKYIFEPFYRGREAVSRQIQGSGLGLHLVRRIAEAHGGTVTVQSEPGYGSAFTIELPSVHDVLVRRGSPVAAGLQAGRS